MKFKILSIIKDLNKILNLDIENYVAVFREFERVEHYQKYHFHTKLI